MSSKSNVRRLLAPSAVIVCASLSLIGCTADTAGEDSVEGMQFDSHTESASTTAHPVSESTSSHLDAESTTASRTESALTGAHPESLLSNVVSGVTSTLGQVAASINACAPLLCCFPTGAEWGQNEFETSLKALGCTTPAAYQERYGTSDWWMYTKCPASPALVSLVAKNATVAPYYSNLAINECLFLNSVASLQLNDVFVQFDPTCTSCKAVAR